MGSSVQQMTCVCQHTDFFVSLILVFKQIMSFSLIQKATRCSLEVGHGNQQAKGQRVTGKEKKQGKSFLAAVQTSQRLK